MLTLMNYWNAVWRSNLAEIEDSFRRHSEPEELAFQRQLRRPLSPGWQRQRFLRYAPPRSPANH